MTLTDKIPKSLIESLSSSMMTSAIAAKPLWNGKIIEGLKSYELPEIKSDRSESEFRSQFLGEWTDPPKHINCRSSTGIELGLTAKQFEESARLLAESSRRATDSMMRAFGELLAVSSSKPWMSEGRTLLPRITKRERLR